MEITVNNAPNQEVKAIDINPQALLEMTQQDSARRYGKVTESDLVAPRPGVLATARDKTGMVAQAITPSSVINFNGIEMTVDRAVKVGILRSDGQGGYQEVSQAERVAQQAQTEQKRQDQLADQMAPGVNLRDIDSDAPELLEGLINGVESSGFSMEQIAMEMIGKPELFRNQTFPSIAKKLGANPQLLADQLNQVGAAVIAQVKATVKPLGVDADEFVDWADKQGSKGAAAYAQAFRGNFMPIKQMVAKFKETNAQGRSGSDRVYLTPQGRRVVSVKMPNGRTQEISEATAIRMGFI